MPLTTTLNPSPARFLVYAFEHNSSLPGGQGLNERQIMAVQQAQPLQNLRHWPRERRQET